MKQMLRFLSLMILWIPSAFSQGEFKGAELIINNGDHYTKSTAVSVEIKAKGAAQMQISNKRDFSDAQWVNYEQVTPSWQLEPVDGEKKVYAKVRDASGNESKALLSVITLDTQAPVNPRMKVFQGDITNDPTMIVDIEFYVEGANFMMVSNSKSFYGQRWEIFKKNYDGWELEKGEDGMRYLFVKFKDAAQNETETISAQILVDTKIPFGGKVEINRGDEFTIQQNKKVMMTIFARDADSMLVSQDGKFEGAVWEPYEATEREIQLEGEDGKKTVYVKFKDKAGNITPVYSDDIILDVTPPRDCSIVIDGGAEVTNHYDKKVSIELKASNVYFVKVSNREDFYGAKWQTFRPTISGWSLEGEDDGEKTVYVKFKDRAGNVSSVFSDSITLKRSN